MDLDLRVKLAIYRGLAETGRAPWLAEVARRAGASETDVREAYLRLAAQRLLVLEPDGVTIAMAPPFSGLPTQHRVLAAGIEYFANCAWDALGICAALHRRAAVHSRCEQSGEALRLRVEPEGPEPSTWLFHCLVPAVHWWRDIRYT